MHCSIDLPELGEVLDQVLLADRPGQVPHPESAGTQESLDSELGQSDLNELLMDVMPRVLESSLHSHRLLVLHHPEGLLTADNTVTIDWRQTRPLTTCFARLY